MKELPTDKKRVTVGIPSYNEEMNISNLLRSIIENASETNVGNQFNSDRTKQSSSGGKDKGFAITEIIISDDSSDSTCQIIEGIAAEYSSLSIRLLHHESRRSVSAAWNEIFREATGEIIILYDADIMLKNSTTAYLVEALGDGIGLCASNSTPLMQKKSITTRASAFIARWLRCVRKNGISEYTVMGRGLSVSSQVAKKITIPDNVIALDLYLQCKVIELGFKIVYDEDAVVYFWPPQNISDFASQIIRAANGHKQIDYLLKGSRTQLSLWSGLSAAIRSSRQDPKGAISLISCYLLLPYYRMKLADTNSAKWHVAKSTKNQG